MLCAGDAVEVVHRPDHGVTIALVQEALLLDPALLPELEPARADMLPRLAAALDARAAS